MKASSSFCSVLVLLVPSASALWKISDYFSNYDKDMYDVYGLELNSDLIEIYKKDIGVAFTIFNDRNGDSTFQMSLEKRKVSPTPNINPGDGNGQGRQRHRKTMATVRKYRDYRLRDVHVRLPHLRPVAECDNVRTGVWNRKILVPSTSEENIVTFVSTIPNADGIECNPSLEGADWETSERLLVERNPRCAVFMVSVRFLTVAEEERSLLLYLQEKHPDLGPQGRPETHPSEQCIIS